MKRGNLRQYIFISIAVMGIIGCIALLLPQIRQVFIGIGEQTIGISLNSDVWNLLLLSTALVYLCIIMAFLIIFFSKFEIPQIAQEKKLFIFAIIEIVLICLYSCMLIFLALSSNAIWMDEAYSLSQIRHSWNDLIQLLIIDVHPPFYFLVLKATSLVFGSSITAMKMVSVFPVILLIILVSRFLKKEFSDRAAIFFLLLCITSKTITHYSIEIRMYSWALFFVTLMFVSSWYFLKSGRKHWWAAVLLCALGSAYTHNYAAVGAGIVYLFLFLYALKNKKDKIVSMVLLAVFGIILYLPWFPSLIGQFTRVSDNFWINPLSILYFFQYVYTVFSTGNYFVSLFLCFMFGYISVLFFIRKNNTEKQSFLFGGLCCAVLLVLIGIFISIIIRPLFVARYLVPMCGLVYLFFAVECSVIDKRRITVFIYVVLISIGIMSFSLSARKEIKENRDFNIFYLYFTGKIQQDDTFIFYPPSDTGSLHIVGIIGYLFPDNIYTVYNVSISPNTLFSKLWGDTYTEYEDNIFHDRRTWIFVMEEEKSNTRNSNYIQQEIKGELSGSFGWDSYRFRLYRRNLPDTTP